MVIGLCFALRPRKIRENCTSFGDKLLFWDERILYVHNISMNILYRINLNYILKIYKEYSIIYIIYIYV